jgi:endoglucanase
MDDTELMLKEITEATGVPGYEGPIRAVLQKYFEPLGELSQDNLGSLICRKQGASASPRVMLAGHLDELGFMVKYITDEGFIKFLPLGGWFTQYLPGQRVVIKTRHGDVDGLIVTKVPHTQSDDPNRLVPIHEMYIDIGVTGKADIEAVGVRVGDPIIQRSDFTVLANKKTYLAKSFDDRVGVGLLVSILQGLQGRSHPNTIYAAGTVLEELGTLGGAQASAHLIEPDVALVMEGLFSGDVLGMKPTELELKLGGGPAVVVADWRMIPNLKLRDLVIDTAESIGVPVQLTTVVGFTDGTAIQLHKTGVPAVIIAVPARYIHSPHSIIHRDDYDMTVKLTLAVIERLTADVVADLKR